MDPKILFENEEVLVVDKPSGLLVHGDGRSSEQTLTDWIIRQYPDTANVGEPAVLQSGVVVMRPGIVHRIDRDTSGVLVVAKTAEAFTYLKEQFQQRSVQKEYRAFVYGVVTEDTAVIDRPIGKSRKDPRLWSAQRGGRGALREAITEYKTLVRGKGTTLLAVFPKTGRTHQIRVHMKAVNHPVVCDSLYAPKMSPRLGFSRLALHAFRIYFTIPSGEKISVEAPLPRDFIEAQKRITEE